MTIRFVATGIFCGFFSVRCRQLDTLFSGGLGHGGVLSFEKLNKVYKQIKGRMMEDGNHL